MSGNKRGYDPVDPCLRFWPKVDKTRGYGPKGDCWIWKGGKTSSGYGVFYFGKRLIMAHRVSFFFHHGNFPEKPLELDHLCRVHSCVNPLHLEAVTRKVNTLRGLAGTVNAKRMLSRTHCANGHPYTPENTVTRKTSYGHKRQCIICERERSYNSFLKHRDKINLKRKERRWQAKQQFSQ